MLSLQEYPSSLSIYYLFLFRFSIFLQSCFSVLPSAIFLIFLSLLFSYYHILQSHCFVHFPSIHKFYSLLLSLSSDFFRPLSYHFSSMSCIFNAVYLHLYSPHASIFVFPQLPLFPISVTYFTLRLLPFYSTSHFSFPSFSYLP